MPIEATGRPWDVVIFPPMVKRLLALVFVSALSGCAHHQVAPQRSLEPGQLASPTLEPLSDAEVLERAGAARYVLVGEQHDAACDHAVEAHLVRLLGAEGTWAVGLEMVAVDQGPTLERFNEGELPVDSLDRELRWKESWGIDFSAYEPIFVAARTTRTPVAALNLPRPVVKAMSLNEPNAVPDELRGLTVPEVIPVGEEQLAFLREAYEGHAHSAPSDEGWRRFLYVQALWDSQMAWRAVQVHQQLDRKLIVVAGAGHVWNGWGIARRLQVFDPDAAILSVVPWRGEGEPDRKEGDLFFYCPEEGGD